MWTLFVTYIFLGEVTDEFIGVYPSLVECTAAAKQYVSVIQEDLPGRTVYTNCVKDGVVLD